MNIELRQPDIAQKTRLKIVDVDIHPKSSIEDLKPYLSNRWVDHIRTYGARTRQGFWPGGWVAREHGALKPCERAAPPCCRPKVRREHGGTLPEGGKPTPAFLCPSTSSAGSAGGPWSPKVVQFSKRWAPSAC